jgi:thiol-disulfide isomerase/thioredoxin
MKVSKIITIIIITVFLSNIALAQQETREITFKVGSEVKDYPEVQWLKGDPITQFDPSKTYIIELWATWCGPCKAAIPHLNDLHRKYGDRIIIIGQSVMENDLNKVKHFVSGKGDGMSYRVAYAGGGSSDFSQKWLIPAGIEGIPESLVIQNNKVVWMAHPSSLTEEIMELLISGQFSLEKVKELQAKANKKNEFEYDGRISATRKLLREKKFNEALIILDSLIKINPHDGEVLAIKGQAIEESGRSDEALKFLEDSHRSVFSIDIIMQYYEQLARYSQASKFYEVVNMDLKRAEGDSEMIMNIVATAFGNYLQFKDYPNMADFLKRVTKEAKSSSPLIAISAMCSISTIPKEAKIVYDAVFEATMKLLNMEQLEFPYLGPLVIKFWTNSDQNQAKAMVKAAIAAAERDNLPINRISSLTKLVQILDKGQIPSEKELMKLYEEAAM